MIFAIHTHIVEYSALLERQMPPVTLVKISPESCCSDWLLLLPLLDSLGAMAERRILRAPSAAGRSPPKHSTERHLWSFLPAATKLYNSSRLLQHGVRLMIDNPGPFPFSHNHCTMDNKYSPLLHSLQKSCTVQSLHVM